MRTPAGEDCRHYYEDFHRGRNVQECRVDKSDNSAAWGPGDCARCAVPAILRANASIELGLEIDIRRGFLGFGQKVKVQAICHKHHISIPDPYVGCPQCHAERPGLDLFAQALENED
jgi:hypothetical protein